MKQKYSTTLLKGFKLTELKNFLKLRYLKTDIIYVTIYICKLGFLKHYAKKTKHRNKLVARPEVFNSLRRPKCLISHFYIQKILSI